MKLTWITETFIKKGYRYIKTRMTAGIVETSKASNPFGFDSRATKNYVAILGDTQSREEPVIIGYLNPRAIEELNNGDSAQYSTDEEGNIVATVILRNNGTAEILGDTDNAVRFSKLKEGYDKTKSVIDAIVSTLDTPINEPGNGAPSAFQAAIAAAVGDKETGDIDESKIDEIKVP